MRQLQPRIIVSSDTIVYGHIRVRLAGPVAVALLSNPIKSSADVVKLVVKLIAREPQGAVQKSRIPSLPCSGVTMSNSDFSLQPQFY